MQRTIELDEAQLRALEDLAAAGVEASKSSSARR